MACLREDLALGVLDDQSEGVLLDFDAAVWGLVGYIPLLCLEGIAEHDIVLVCILRLHRCCEHPDTGRTGGDPLNLDLERWVVLVGGIGEIEHLHAHGPIAIEVERLTGRQPVALPLHQSLTFRRIEIHKRIGEEVGVRQVVEIGRYILLHTLQVLHPRIRLDLGQRREE